MKCLICEKETGSKRQTCSSDCLNELRKQNAFKFVKKNPRVRPFSGKDLAFVPWEDENAEKEFIERIVE